MALRRIHITGASGSGTTTLGKELSKRFEFKHLDSDSYFWNPTNPPFQEIREVELRKKLLQTDMLKYTNWVSSGSLCGWGDFATEYFDLVIFLFIPQELRIIRLYEREKLRSPESFIDGTIRQKQFDEFIAWAKRYDNGGMDVRSLMLHQTWLENLNCPVLKIEGEHTVEKSVNKVMEYIANNNQ